MNRLNPKTHVPVPKHAKRVFQGERWEVFQWEQECFDGSKAIYESLKRKDSVVVFPIIDNKVVILEEEQPHWGNKSYSLVGGGIEDNENPVDGAKRELKEETGLIFEDYYLIGIHQYTPGIDHYSYTFVANNLLKETKQKFDPGEKIEIRKISIDHLLELTQKREFYYNPVFIDEMIIQNRIPEFIDMLKNPEKHKLNLEAESHKL